jgi:hypothetical protein
MSASSPTSAPSTANSPAASAAPSKQWNGGQGGGGHHNNGIDGETLYNGKIFTGLIVYWGMGPFILSDNNTDIKKYIQEIIDTNHDEKLNATMQKMHEIGKKLLFDSDDTDINQKMIQPDLYKNLTQ